MHWRGWRWRHDRAGVGLASCPVHTATQLSSWVASRRRCVLGFRRRKWKKHVYAVLNNNSNRTTVNQGKHQVPLEQCSYSRFQQHFRFYVHNMLILLHLKLLPHFTSENKEDKLWRVALCDVVAAHMAAVRLHGMSCLLSQVRLQCTAKCTHYSPDCNQSGPSCKNRR